MLRDQSENSEDQTRQCGVEQVEQGAIRRVVLADCPGRFPQAMGSCQDRNNEAALGGERRQVAYGLLAGSIGHGLPRLLKTLRKVADILLGMNGRTTRTVMPNSPLSLSLGGPVFG